MQDILAKLPLKNEGVDKIHPTEELVETWKQIDELNRKFEGKLFNTYGGNDLGSKVAKFNKILLTENRQEKERLLCVALTPIGFVGITVPVDNPKEEYARKRNIMKSLVATEPIAKCFVLANGQMSINLNDNTGKPSSWSTNYGEIVSVTTEQVQQVLYLT
jgi:hypothetical protein